MLVLKLFYFLPLLLRLVYRVEAGYTYDKTYYGAYLCSSLAVTVNFTCSSPSDSYYYCQCNHIPELQSILICLNEYMDTEKQVHKAYKKIISICEEYNYTLTYDELTEQYANGTKYVVNATSENFNATLPNYSPVRFDPVTSASTYKTYEVFYKEYGLGTYYGGGMMAYWLLVILIGAFSNFFRKLTPKLLLKVSGRPVNLFRQYITLPATGHSRHVDPLGYFMLVPLRRDTIVLLGYLLLNLVLTIHKYELFLPNTFYDTKRTQLLRYLADRTGIISFMHFPALFLFGGRNNLFLWLTGWKYETFIVYHKWIGRGMTAHAFIHSVAWTVYAMDYHYYTYYAEDAYWRWGIVATILCCLILFQALYIFRAKCYEIFLAIHIIFAALFMVGCWYHCIELGWMEYVYASIAIWAFDRFIRIVRILWFGVFKEATFQLFDEDTVKMTIDRPNSWKPFPGAFVYLYVLQPRHFWQSHPFTIIASSNHNDKQISIIFKAKNGLTETIRNQILQIPDHRTKFRTLIEGPYGGRPSIDKYDSALLITGGHGIPTGLCNADDLSRRQQGSQRITLVWIIPYIQSMLWIEEELNKLNNGRCSILVFCTRGVSPSKTFTTPNLKLTETDSESDEKSKESLKLEKLSSSDLTFEGMQKRFPFITIQQGRPNLEELILNEMEISAGSVGIISCGPGFLSDSLRKTIANNLNKCKGRVDYFEESQAW